VTLDITADLTANVCDASESSAVADERRHHQTVVRDEPATMSAADAGDRIGETEDLQFGQQTTFAVSTKQIRFDVESEGRSISNEK